MTTTQPAALPEHTIGKHDHPEPHTMCWSDSELAAIKRYAESYALAALQSQPAAEVSDEEIERVARSHGTGGWQTLPDMIRFARAILALRPQSESAAPTVEAAREMGAKGGPVVEAERLAFEAWMAGHCWAVSPTWNGKTYDDSEEDKKRKLLDPLARTTRMLWAAWRDRAALSSLRPQAVPMTELPDFDELPDEAIDNACAAGGIYRADLMRAWESLRTDGITAQGAQGEQG